MADRGPRTGLIATWIAGRVPAGTAPNEARPPGKAGGMSGDTRETGHGQGEPAGYDQEDDVAEYQSQLDATSENPANRERDSQFEDAAQWADERPRKQAIER